MTSQNLRHSFKERSNNLDIDIDLCNQDADDFNQDDYLQFQTTDEKHSSNKKTKSQYFTPTVSEDSGKKFINLQMNSTNENEPKNKYLSFESQTKQSEKDTLPQTDKFHSPKRDPNEDSFERLSKSIVGIRNTGEKLVEVGLAKRIGSFVKNMDVCVNPFGKDSDDEEEIDNHVDGMINNSINNFAELFKIHHKYNTLNKKAVTPCANFHHNTKVSFNIPPEVQKKENCKRGSVPETVSNLHIGGIDFEDCKEMLLNLASQKHKKIYPMGKLKAFPKTTANNNKKLSNGIQYDLEPIPETTVRMSEEKIKKLIESNKKRQGVFGEKTYQMFSSSMRRMSTPNSEESKNPLEERKAEKKEDSVSNFFFDDDDESENQEEEVKMEKIEEKEEEEKKETENFTNKSTKSIVFNEEDIKKKEMKNINTMKTKGNDNDDSNSEKNNESLEDELLNENDNLFFQFSSLSLMEPKEKEKEENKFGKQENEVICFNKQEEEKIFTNPQ